MGFLTQLQLLLWKNINLRKRQKLRGFIEITAPLTLFIILIYVRTKGLRENTPECHFDDKAMPSAGLLPFIQKMICSMDNKCRTEGLYNGMFEDLTKFEDSLLTRSLTKLKLVLDDKSVINNLTTISQAFELFSGFFNQSTLQRIAQADSVGIRKILKNNTNLSELLQSANLSIPSPVLQSILDAEIKPQGLISILPMIATNNQSNIPSFSCNSDFISRLLKFSNPSDAQSVADYFCSLNTTDQQKIFQILISETNQTAVQNLALNSVFGARASNLNLSNISRTAIDLQKAISDVLENSNVKNLRLFTLSLFEELSMKNSSLVQFGTFLCGQDSIPLSNFPQNGFIAQIQNYQKKTILAKYVYDKSISEFCNNEFERLENSTISKFLWDNIKPIVRGKILYAPDTPATRKIIKQVNSTFVDFASIQNLAKFWIEMSPNIHTSIESNQSNIITFLREYAKDPEKYLAENPQTGLLLVAFSEILASSNISQNITSLLYDYFV